MTTHSLSTQIIFEKSGIPSKGIIPILLRLVPELQHNKPTAVKVNLALAIDTSGSMSEPVQRYQLQPFQYNPAAPLWNGIPNGIGGQMIAELPRPLVSNQRPVSKMDQAIDSAVKAVNLLKDGDRLSLILFNSTTQVMVPSTIISLTTRSQIITLIRSLRAGGGTDLHSGWLSGAEQVAHHLQAAQLNRVLIFSDGQTNQGQCDLTSIFKDVAQLCSTGVSTSTFGIGDGFNEDLLEGIAEHGNGNFYFIQEDGQLDRWMTEELQGISRMVGQSVQVEFIPASGVKVHQNYNDYSMIGTRWKLPNLIHEHTLDALFSLELEALPKKIKDRDLGTFIICYKDNEGQDQVQKILVKGTTVSEKVYQTETPHHEVQVVMSLLEIARAKRNATQQMTHGNYAEAKIILQGSLAMAASVGDARTLAETQSLNTMISGYDHGDKNILRKTLVSQTYNTRNSK